MSYHIYFSFSSGLQKPIKAPKGTYESILRWIFHTEECCGLTRTPSYTPEGEKQRPGWHWSSTERSMLDKAGPPVDREQNHWWLQDRERDERISRISSVVRAHNDRVRGLYEDITKWQEKKWKRGEVEKITPKMANEFWGGLTFLDLPRELWTREHFVDHMEHLYVLLSTGSSRGQNLDCPPFDGDQTSALINVFEDELDQWGFDCRFEVPLDENLKRYDFLASSYDGGYDWCEDCGPIYSDAFFQRCRVCPAAKEGKCHLKNDHPAEFEDEEE